MAFDNGNVHLPADAHREIRRGVTELVDVIRPTLGPLPRLVLLGSSRGAPGQQVDSGGLIAGHLVHQPSLQGNVGLLTSGQALLQLQDRQGDGTAVCAVMLEQLVAAGTTYLAAGGNIARLRRYLLQGLSDTVHQLDAMRSPVSGAVSLTRLAGTIAHDDELAGCLGEIVDVIGEHGRFEVKQGRGSGLDLEFVDGMYWDKGLVSTAMANQPLREEAYLEDPGIFVTNYYFADATTLAPVLDAAIAAGFKSLLIIALGFSDQAIALMTWRANQERLWTVGVELPGLGEERTSFIEDMAALTGALPLLRRHDYSDELDEPTSRQLRFTSSENFGRARRAWATRGSTGISGPYGDSLDLRHHLAALCGRLERQDGAEAKRQLRARIGRLIGGSATLWVGAPNPIALEQRMQLALRTAEALRGALREGVVPGGGAALLACRPATEARRRECSDVDERAACGMLLRALEAPARAIIANSGREPDAVLEDIRRAGAGHGFDALAGRVAPMLESGIADAATVVKGSLQTAVSAAISLLATEIVVSTRGPVGSPSKARSAS